MDHWNSYTSKYQEDKCRFCGQNSNDVLLGEKYSLDNLICHYYCILLSSQIKQEGEDNEGILGFTYKNIVDELNRGKNIKCHYCQRKGATLQCKRRGCTKTFHLPCGIQKGCSQIFKDDFPTFCPRHAKKYSLPAYLKKRNLICLICLFELDLSKERKEILRSKCCGKENVYHRRCLQKYVSNAGSESRCPHCKNKHKFIQFLEERGIFQPIRPASWDLPSGRAQFPQVEEEENIIRCDETECLVGDREMHMPNTGYEIIQCNRCLNGGAHRMCANSGSSDGSICATCRHSMSILNTN